MENLDAIWNKIGSVSKEDVIRAVLLDEIAVHQSRLQPHDTGHLHTAIGVLEHRLEELDPYSGLWAQHILSVMGPVEKA